MMEKESGQGEIASLPLLNEPAPNFEAATTEGVIRLSDYQGRWVILFAHPADFTPVCTSEIVELARRHQEFKDLNCELVGISVDSRFSHIAWLRSIKDRFGVDVCFPIIDDQRMKVARLYGMIHRGASDTSAVRAVFIIDDEGLMRAMVYYPMSVGRSVSELLRVLQALQTADKGDVALPEGWTPGQPAVAVPPETRQAADRLSEESGDAVDWYYVARDTGK